ncbi:MAG: hypothetical protein IPK16_32015 [Anaerolineales bacterium]|nr:hypothetical protein [Anaerolineales bacterium]
MHSTRSGWRSRDITLRWLLPMAGLVSLIGYWGSWVAHPVAGLAILGLDLGEYVKFLPSIRSGQIQLWREGFYLPLVAVSLAFSLFAYRPELRYPRWLRLLFLAVAIVAALNLLPPAWTPARMMTDEFQQQALAILLCLTAVAFSPVLALWKAVVTGALIALLSLVAVIVPVWQFFRVLPGISILYNHALSWGWGVGVMGMGLLALTAGGVLLTISRSPTRGA